MTYYLIYKITNKVNGKIYIGQHKTDDLNDCYMGSGTAIKRAIKKHGVENFTKEILYFCTDFDTMNMMEEMLVNETFVARKDTYNLKTGGEGGIPSEEARRKMSEVHKGKTLSLEQRQKISNSLKGNHHVSEDGKRKISEANRGRQYSVEQRKHNSGVHKGARNHNYGKPRSEETRRKIAASLMGHSVSKETRQKISQHSVHHSPPNKGLPVSEEQKRKISETLKNCHRKWWTNGIDSVLSEICPEGYVHGRVLAPL